MKRILLFLVVGFIALSCNNNNNNAPTYVANQEQLSDTTIEVKEEPKEEEPQPKAENNPVDPVKAVYGLVLDSWKNEESLLFSRNKENFTKRFLVYDEAIGWDVDVRYETQDCYCPDAKPTLTIHADNPYVFDIKWTRYNGSNSVKRTAVVAIEDGKWKIDNYIEGNGLYIDYSVPIQKVFSENYPDTDYKVSASQIADSKKIPEFVPRIK